jgi:sugar lactone lactonase YvrE
MVRHSNIKAIKLYSNQTLNNSILNLEKNNMKNLYISLIFSFLTLGSFAQSASIDPNQGIAFPQFTTSFINSMTTQPKGTVVFDKDLNQMKYWNGTVWQSMNVATGGGALSLTENNIANSNSGNFGIGTQTPTNKVDIKSEIPNKSGLTFSNLTASNTSNDYLTSNNVSGLAVDASGNLYATNFYGNFIYKYSPNGQTTNFVVTGLSKPHDLAFGPDGNLYVSSYGANTVLKVTMAGVVSIFASGFDAPVGLTFDNNGNLYVCNNNTGKLSKINAAGTVVNHNFGSDLSFPYGCVFDAVSNKIYIANYGENEVAQIDVATGGAKTTYVAGISLCTGITLDGQRNLYVAQAGPNKVTKITPNGTIINFANTRYPFDLTFDNAGNLYVANLTINKISVVRPSFSSLLTVDNNGEVVKSNSLNGGNIISLSKSDGISTLILTPEQTPTEGANISLYNNNLIKTIEIDADYGVNKKGRIILDEIQIKGGADLSENFNISENLRNDIKPGMIVSIDKSIVGGLQITNKKYDSKIIGVISGANGIETGLNLGQSESIANGKYPVALVGRVYVLANSEAGEIKSGDFLTSSSSLGYAMKVKNKNKAQGAIIGKAMSGIDKKTGFVLVLINLQ